MSTTRMSPCLLAGKEAAAPSSHRNNPLRWLMRLDTEYYTHAKQEATNWVTCLYLPVIQLISTMHVDHWGMGGRGNEITVSRTEHSGVLRKGLCSSKEGVSLPLLTNTLKKDKSKAAVCAPQPCNNIYSANGLHRRAGISWVYWMQRKCVLGVCKLFKWDIIHLHFRTTVFISSLLLPFVPHCFFFRTGVHSPVKSHWSVVQPCCRK